MQYVFQKFSFRKYTCTIPKTEILENIFQLKNIVEKYISKFQFPQMYIYNYRNWISRKLQKPKKNSKVVKFICDEEDDDKEICCLEEEREHDEKEGNNN